MEITDTLKSRSKNFFKISYKIYQFIAKVFLYSILLILIGVAVLFILYFVDMQKNLKNNDLKAPLFGAYIIISPSMDPTIKVQDAIVIMRTEAKDLKKGDIITFLSSDARYSGLTITHRIVGVEKSDNGDIFFRTKGDNNNAEDSALVSVDNIYGKVILKIPKIGYVQYVLTQSYGIVFLVVIPCLGIVIYDIIKLIKSIKSNVFKSSNKKNNKKEVKEDVEIIGAPVLKDSSTSNYDSDDDVEIL